MSYWGDGRDSASYNLTLSKLGKNDYTLWAFFFGITAVSDIMAHLAQTYTAFRIRQNQKIIIQNDSSFSGFAAAMLDTLFSGTALHRKFVPCKVMADEQ